METIKSFKGYGKVEPAEEQAFRQKTRRRIIILVVSSIVLISLIVGAVIGVVITKKNNSSSSSNSPSQLTPAASLKTVCNVTHYPDSCYSSISSLEASNTTDPEVIFKLSLRLALDEVSKVKDLPSQMIQSVNDTVLKDALNVCVDVFDDAVERLNDSVSSMVVGEGKQVLSGPKIDDLKTWLSSSITDLQTCLDALQELNSTHYNSTILEQIQTATHNSTEFTSNSLAIVTKILSLLSSFNLPIHRKLLSHRVAATTSNINNDFPEWVTLGDRRLLQETNPTPNVTVASDGKGDVKTINEAVAKIPKKSISRFIIYVKAGTYVEKVTLDKSKWNVMIYGDGITRTTISGSLNFVDGTPTFATATFSVVGKGFIAKGINFINTAGPAKHQAVAFRSGSDMSVYYQCKFDAYQDTLYAHSNRQFYRDCQITGTIDFIFGNAAVVFQSCTIQPRQPMTNQFNTITAQGKVDSNQNTGISIQKCTISASGVLTAQTYLGRPWKNFSTTVVMQSNIGSFLNPLGWTPWISGVDPPSSIFYGEYQNTGPGSSVAGRVKWAGYYPALTVDKAGKFTVGSLIQGAEWLPASSVTYDNSL